MIVRQRSLLVSSNASTSNKSGVIEPVRYGRYGGCNCMIVEPFEKKLLYITAPASLCLFKGGVLAAEICAALVGWKGRIAELLPLHATEDPNGIVAEI